MFGPKLQLKRGVAQSEATTRGGLGGDTALQVVPGYQSLWGSFHVWLQSKYSAQEKKKLAAPGRSLQAPKDDWKQMKERHFDGELGLHYETAASLLVLTVAKRL